VFQTPPALKEPLAEKSLFFKNNRTSVRLFFARSFPTKQKQVPMKIDYQNVIMEQSKWNG
jgi:hypothetical protein